MTRIDFDYPDLRSDTGKLVPTHVGVEHVKDMIIARAVAQGDTLLTEEQAEKLVIFFTRLGLESLLQTQQRLQCVH